VNNC